MEEMTALVVRAVSRPQEHDCIIHAAGQRRNRGQDALPRNMLAHDLAHL